MTRIELQAKVYTDIMKCLESMPQFKVDARSWPGTIYFWPNYDVNVCKLGLQMTVEKFYEFIEEYVHTYASNVTIEHGEECIRLTF